MSQRDLDLRTLHTSFRFFADVHYTLSHKYFVDTKFRILLSAALKRKNYLNLKNAVGHFKKKNPNLIVINAGTF